VAQAQAITSPVDVDAMVEAIRRFDAFKAKALGQDDYVTIERRPYVKKSGWLKYAMACNLSLSIIQERMEKINLDGKEILVFNYDYRATAPSGRFADASGSASSDEAKTRGLIHNIRALAQTRAMNRAISNLVGGGSVSAEEMDASAHSPDFKPRYVSSTVEVGHLDKGAKIPAEHNGNEQDPTTLWLNILAENGVDAGTIDLLEMTDLGEYKMKIKPTKFLGDVWGPINEVVKANRGTWIKPPEDPKNGYWEVPY